MKGILKKNQVIITALVIMIAVAGYLNFTQDKLEDVPLADGKDVVTNADSIDENKTADNDLVLDDTKTATNGSTENDAKTTGDDLELGSVTYDSEGNEVLSLGKEEGELLDLSAEDLGEDDLAEAGDKTDTVDVAADGDGSSVGEAVLVSNMLQADYFAAAKLDREQNRAKSKETLMELVDNTTISEKQKQNAIDTVIRMTAIAEKESAAEMLLEAKGFKEVVVRMVDDNIDVIVNAENLTQQQMAQIEDIVKRKTGITAENIVITPVKVE